MSNTIIINNNSNIEAFSGRNFTRNIQRVDTKSDVGPGTIGGDNDTEFLAGMFAVSAVGGFVAVKILSSVL